MNNHTTLSEKNRLYLGYDPDETWWDVRCAVHSARIKVNHARIALEDALDQSQGRYCLSRKAELTQKLGDRLTALKQAMDALERARAL